MQLLPALRQAIDRAVQGFPVKDLQRASESLSVRYRTEQAAATPHLSSDLLAAAYLATRLPATYSAVREALQKVRQVQSSFEPKTMLDAGSGPGTALFAAAAEWSSLQSARLVESSGPVRKLGEQLVPVSGVGEVQWDSVNLATLARREQYDLTVCAYVLSELTSAQQNSLVERLWQMTSGVMLIVEPGTPSGWQRILEARRVLIEGGADVMAPCPHAMACPLLVPDWCHFAARVERSKLHRLIKQADVPWEDEKFIYLAVSRTAVEKKPEARVLMQPVIGHGQIGIKLCNCNGTMTNSTVRKRDGAIFKQARRADWGDELVAATVEVQV